MQTLSSTERTHNLSILARERFDVLVIGGGVTGAGVALDAAARGYKVALVEKVDFASGTSSKALSTMMRKPMTLVSRWRSSVPPPSTALPLPTTPR
ncbi:MAG TPA: FAD-dependent oxidoreductase [Ktedonobacteraceae bacterium]|nr:FAD-dependent oxidoreductase [Ktedonobacteraceae bacterium]